MSTIMQTVDIHPNRQVSLNFAVPDDFPLGTADVSIQITHRYLTNQAVSQDLLSQPDNITEDTDRHEKLMSFAGALADCPAFTDDATEIQHKMRSEWDDRDIQIVNLLSKSNV